MSTAGSALAHQQQTPVFDALCRYARERGISLPQKKDSPTGRLDVPGEEVLSLTASEVLGSADLYAPTGPLAQAQSLAAEAFGADRTFFLVNGTTCGIQAMILSVCNPGDKIIIPRNAHRSVVASLVLSGAEPVYVQPEFVPRLGMTVGVTPQQISAAIEAYPDAKAVLVTCPTYYGVVADLEAIAAPVHRQGIPLLVDEAHGPHFAFHPDLPPPALLAGADMTVQSTHKILTSMTQSSMLHCRGDRVDVRRTAALLGLLQTENASALLLTSLDLARWQMASEGEILLGRTIALAAAAREEINRIPGLYCFGQEMTGQPGIFALDPTKLTVNVSGLGLSGPEVDQMLRADHRVQVEMADSDNILALLTVGDREEDVRRLVRALDRISRQAGGHSSSRYRKETLPFPPVAHTKAPLWEAFWGTSRVVSLQEAKGLISTRTILPYPPGIPVLCPGEEVSPEIIEYLDAAIDLGLRVQGMHDPEQRTIRVLAV